MSRNIDSALLTAAQQEKLSLIMLVKLELDTPIYAHTGVGNLIYEGNTYEGVGNLGNISAVSENLILENQEIDLSLSGINSAYISLLLNENFQGKIATIYWGLRNLITNALIAPTVIFKGLISNDNIAAGKNASITLKLSHPFVRWKRSKVSRYTDAEQKALYPTDKGLEFINRLIDQQIIWGREEKK